LASSPAREPGSHFELFDPEEKRKLAKRSRWAAILTGTAALLSAIAALLSLGRTPGGILTTPRDGAIIFGDLIGKLGVLRIECAKCGRSGQ